jgi:hypothetical protein
MDVMRQEAAQLRGSIDDLLDRQSLTQPQLRQALGSLNQHVGVMSRDGLSGLDDPDGPSVIRGNLDSYARGIVDRAMHIAGEFDRSVKAMPASIDRKGLSRRINQAISAAQALRAIFVKCEAMTQATISCLADLAQASRSSAPAPVEWPAGLVDRPLASVHRINVPPVSESDDQTRIRLNRTNLHNTAPNNWVHFTLLVYHGQPKHYRLLVGDGHDSALTSGHRVTGSIQVVQRSPKRVKRVAMGARRLLALRPKQARRELSVVGGLYVQTSDKADDTKFETEILRELRLFTHKKVEFRRGDIPPITG